MLPAEYVRFGILLSIWVSTPRFRLQAMPNASSACWNLRFIGTDFFSSSVYDWKSTVSEFEFICSIVRLLLVQMKVKQEKWNCRKNDHPKIKRGHPLISPFRHEADEAFGCIAKCDSSCSSPNRPVRNNFCLCVTQAILPIELTNQRSSSASI